MIPRDIQKRIFEKFFTTKQAKNGTGLGLAIVKKIADEHKANLKLHSDNDFTRFTIEFPK
jgi:signal transduction histidine kinase